MPAQLRSDSERGSPPPAPPGPQGPCWFLRSTEKKWSWTVLSYFLIRDGGAESLSQVNRPQTCEHMALYPQGTQGCPVLLLKGVELGHLVTRCCGTQDLRSTDSPFCVGKHHDFIAWEQMPPLARLPLQAFSLHPVKAVLGRTCPRGKEHNIKDTKLHVKANACL